MTEPSAPPPSPRPSAEAAPPEAAPPEAGSPPELAPHEYVVRIRESHLDTFGHVNNAMYLTLFEEARWEMITSRGYGIPKIQETRLGPVILEANVRFRRELPNRELVTIQTSLLSQEGKLGRLRQRVLREDGKLSCEAVFVIGLWDIDARKLVLPTDEWLEAIGLSR